MPSPLLIILAGGASSRLWPLEEKSLIKFMGQPLLCMQLDRYAQLGLREVVIVANPENEGAIRARAQTVPDVQVEVVIQPEPKGMGDALLKVRDYLDWHGNRTIYVTQVHDLTDITLHQQMVTAYDSGAASAYLAGYRVTDYFPGGYLEVNSSGRITNMIEKPGAGNEPSDLVNIVAHVHGDAMALLDYIQEEYEKPDTSDDHYERAMARMMVDRRFQVVPYEGAWQAIKYPWHVLDVMMSLLQQIQQPRIAPDVMIEEGVLIKGNVVIEAGARLFHGATVVGPAYIGPHAIVGNGALVRESMVGAHSVVGYSTEVARSYMGEGVHTHVCQVLDSVLDDGVNLSASCTTANLRIDQGPVWSRIKGQRVNSGRGKLGLVAGKNSFIGVNVMTMPGVKLGAHSEIGPTTVVHEDVPDHTRVWVEQSLHTKSLTDRMV